MSGTGRESPSTVRSLQENPEIIKSNRLGESRRGRLPPRQRAAPRKRGTRLERHVERGLTSVLGAEGYKTAVGLVHLDTGDINVARAIVHMLVVELYAALRHGKWRSAFSPQRDPMYFVGGAAELDEIASSTESDGPSGGSELDAWAATWDRMRRIENHRHALVLLARLFGRDREWMSDVLAVTRSTLRKTIERADRSFAAHDRAVRKLKAQKPRVARRMRNKRGPHRTERS